MDSKIFDDLHNAILEYDTELAEILARRIVDERHDLVKAIDSMTDALSKIGDGFAKGDLFLPDLVVAGASVSKAMPILEKALERARGKREISGTVVIGTVRRDIHTIGKGLVASLLTAAGFLVIDIGINISPKEFVESVKKYKPDILAMSALMTTTAPEQKMTIDNLIRDGIRDQVKIMVGGSAITQDFADSIGADGYDPTAIGALDLANRLLDQQTS